MEEFIKANIKLRNISLLIIFVGIIIIVFWFILYLFIPANKLLYLIYIGIALFLAGLLLLTRIQFFLWAEKKAHEE